MIVVTGGAGFIGSNLSRALKKKGEKVLIVDDLENQKYKNIIDIDIDDYINIDDFYQLIGATLETGEKPFWKAVLHNGAISSTTASNTKEVMLKNFDYSKFLLELCARNEIPFIYASSASVYGQNKSSKEEPKNEKPINLYAFSKLLFDNYVRNFLKENSLNCQIVGLRYFNVYGEREFHKQGQSSPMLRYWQEIRSGKHPRVYEGDDGSGNNSLDCQRDFIYIKDVVDVVLWFLENKEISGIFNVGTGVTTKFEDVAKYVIKWFLEKDPELNLDIDYVEMPSEIKGGSQFYTCANLEKLKKVGYNKSFTPISEGITSYLNWLIRNV